MLKKFFSDVLTTNSRAKYLEKIRKPESGRKQLGRGDGRKKMLKEFDKIITNPG